MTWLLENPLLVLVLGGITALVFGALWLHSGRKPALIAMLVVIAGVVSVLIAGRVIQSDRAAVRATIHRIARDVERNDVEALLRHIHSSVPGVRERAASEMPRYKFEEVKVKQNLEIEVFPQESPPRATAEFNVVVVASDRSGLINGRQVPRFVRITFLKEEDSWRLADYAHDDPREGYKRRPK